MATLTLDQKTLPTVPVDASEAFLEALIDLFKVKIRNDNTRYAYKHALERLHHGQHATRSPSRM